MRGPTAPPPSSRTLRDVRGASWQPMRVLLSSCAGRRAETVGAAADAGAGRPSAHCERCPAQARVLARRAPAARSRA
eukprot:1431117-Prymnesium_polylepis.1